MPFAPSALAFLLLQLAAHAAVIRASPLSTSVGSSSSVRRRTDETVEGSSASHGVIVWVAVAAAAVVVVLVAAAFKLQSKRRATEPVVKVELEEVAISPGEPALVQTPSSTRMFVYTAHI